MIISEKYRFAFVEVPKTGSTSMRRWLQQHYGGDLHDWWHSREIPPGSWTKFLVRRDPCDRVVSLWSWTTRQHPWAYPGVPPDFRDFQEWLAEGAYETHPFPTDNPFRKKVPPEWRRWMFRPQSWYEKGTSWDRILDFSTLEEEALGLPWVGYPPPPFPRLNPGQKGREVDVDRDLVDRWEARHD